jgi:hypothetical protein
MSINNLGLLSNDNEPEHHSSDSLVAALMKARIPTENHEFIRRFTSAVGIVDYRAVVETDKPYVVATRRDGLRDLRIYYGYTTGFTSLEETARLFGEGAAHDAKSPKGTWWVEHPTNQVRPGGERTRNVRREAGFCACGMQLSLTGSCENCD